MDQMDEPLTSNVRPATDLIITVRIVKSFPYRNVKNHIIKSVNLKETTPLQLLQQMKDTINTTGGLRPYRTVEYNTVKVYSHAHGTKSMNLVINFDHDDTDILYSDQEGVSQYPVEKTLHDLGVENETELSIFNYAAYQEFKANPEEKWL